MWSEVLSSGGLSPLAGTEASVTGKGSSTGAWRARLGISKLGSECWCSCYSYSPEALPYSRHLKKIFLQSFNLAEGLIVFSATFFVKHTFLLDFVTPQCFPLIILATLFKFHLLAPSPLLSDF